MSAPSKYPGFQHDHEAGDPFRGLLRVYWMLHGFPGKEYSKTQYQLAVPLIQIKDLAPLYPALLGEVSPAAAAPAAEKAAAEEKAGTAAVEKATVGTEAGWGGGGRRSSLEPYRGRRAGDPPALPPNPPQH